MPAGTAARSTISPEFVTRLGERAQEAEQLRRLPQATIDDLSASGFTDLLVPARFGGSQAEFPAILDPVRRMAHGCASSAWTVGFFALHNWMLALFDERAQAEAFAKQLKSQGYRFVGPTSVYAFMQNVGVVNDHVHGCFRATDYPRSS